LRYDSKLLFNKKLSFIDSYWALILPGAISAYNMIILMNFFRAIPEEMEDAAHIDGAGDLRILVLIILPLSLPAIATISLFYTVAKWNTFMSAVIYSNSMSKYLLQVVLRQIIFQDESMGGSTDDVLYTPPESKKAASIFFSVIPILCVYPFLQKYFVKGVMIGAVKG
jgi:putative aldouronate transport system permease protein